jgi:hypothetical protein
MFENGLEYGFVCFFIMFKRCKISQYCVVFRTFCTYLTYITQVNRSRYCVIELDPFNDTHEISRLELLFFLSEFVSEISERNIIRSLPTLDVKCLWLFRDINYVLP